MFDSDDEADLEQSELPYLTKWNQTIPWDHQIPSQLSGEATNPAVLRTFDSEGSPILIVGYLEPATRLDKQGDRWIHDGVVAASFTFVYNVVT